MIRTTCPYCGVGCGVRVASATISGDPDHPANLGKLCVKGAALKDAVDLPERLLCPTLGGAPTDWDHALDHIASELLSIRDRDGADAIGFYVSGQLLTEDYYVANKLMKGFIGSANIDTNSRLCMSSSVAGHIRAFGEDVVPGCYDDLEEADLVVLAGSNMAWCHPVLYQRLVAARERRGTKIVTIDPRRTATAETADLQLALKPGSDVALWLGLLVHLADGGNLDHAWIDQHVEGADSAIAAARRWVPSVEAAAAASGLDVLAVRTFFRMFADTERVVTLYSQGVNQSVAGTDKVNAIINCHLATARIGRPGMGPFSLTGQPNAMGGREVGGLATTLAAHMNFTPVEIDRVRRFWNAPHIATKPGLKAVEMFEAVRQGKIKAIWIAATNPAASMPQASVVRAALAACPLVIVSDAWATDTTALADIVLPAAAWAEKDGTVTNSERCISRQRRFREAPGAARPDWWMFAEVGRRMGWGTAFGYRGPSDIFREHAALSAFENSGERLFDLGGLATLEDAGYEALAPVQWPIGANRRAAQRLFARGGFPTQSGKAQMVALSSAEKAEDQEFPLVLNTGRLRDQWHTMTRTGRIASLMRHTPAPVLALHPDVAARKNIASGGLVQIETRLGSAVMRAALDESLQPGEVYAAMHWTDQYTSSGPIAQLVHAARDPFSGQPDLKGTPARLKAMTETWRGQLLRWLPGVPASSGAIWWSKAQIERGFAFDLLGWSALTEILSSEAALRAFVGIGDHHELVQFSFPRGAVYRFAGFDGDRLLACAFFGPAGAALPEAELARELIGKALSASERLALLAGTSDAPTAPRSRTICSCFAVSEAAIRQAITERGHASVGDIGGHLRAGTNCGSCIPELKKLLAERSPAQGAR